MITKDEAEQVVAGTYTLVERTGRRVGPVRRVFLDEYTGWPSFATVTLGPEQQSEADQETFVALHEADLSTDTITVPYAYDMIIAAPHTGTDEVMSTADEDALFDYYGVPIDGASPSVEHLGTVLVPAGPDEVAEVDTDTTA